jgi:hypothetical protein
MSTRKEKTRLHTMESGGPTACGFFADEITARITCGRVIIGRELDPWRSEDCAGKWARQLNPKVVFELWMRMQDVGQQTESHIATS